MKTTITNNITRVQRSIACGLLMCGLLTSCPSGSNVQIRPQLEENLPTDATSPEPVDSSLGETTSCIEQSPLSAPSAIQAADQAFQYYKISGDPGTIKLDSPYRTVGAIIQAIKTQEGLDSCYCSLACGEILYTQDSIDPVEEILALAKTSDEPINLIKVSNTEKAKEILGNNYLGEKAWKKLDIEVSSLPPLSDRMLAEARRLQTQGEQPLLVLDLGISIAEIGKRCQANGINFSGKGIEGEVVSAQSYYTDRGTCARWLLLPGSDHGVLPGSRNMRYDAQVQYMEANYQDYEVGEARQLVTLTTLKYIQDWTVLFPQGVDIDVDVDYEDEDEDMLEEGHAIWGNCKEQYQLDFGVSRPISLLSGNYCRYNGSRELVFYFATAYDTANYGLFCFLGSIVE